MNNFVIILFGLEKLRIGGRNHGGNLQCGKHIITQDIQFKIVCITGTKELDINLIRVDLFGHMDISMIILIITSETFS